MKDTSTSVADLSALGHLISAWNVAWIKLDRYLVGFQHGLVPS